ncbi:MATE family efflux transporter [Ferviditalea candida]|uniref:Probable multidrug resistance protein NorM n=1 Tax=Ferviditalea candida TaxID=3108399 RepID=A0ABU5ZKG3_9BACL|nr:MATE family efflux transporter [Paenibacillaceae bacterium T2]
MKNTLATKNILLLAWPAIVESFLISAVGFVDTLFISKLGLSEVAAVGVTNAIMQIYFAVFMSIATASTIFISRASGENNVSKVRDITAQAILLSLFAGLVLGAISFFFSESMLSIMGASPDVLQVGIPYFQIVAVPSIILSLFFTAGAILRGSGDTRTPLRVGLWMNAVHIVLDYVLIFGVFFDGFGIKGAAMATLLSRLFSVVFLLWYLHNRRLISPLRLWSIRRDLLAKLSRLATPAALERLFMRMGQILYFGMIIRMGTEVYAAHTLTGNFTMFSTIVGTGLAVATTTLIGNCIGAKQIEEAKKLGTVAIWVSSLVMTAVLFIVWGISFTATHLFTDDPFVIRLIVTILLIDVIAQPATGAVTALTAILQAGGDTKFPMYVTLFGIWGIRTLGVYMLGVHLGLGLIGAWIAIAMDNYIRAVILFIRYRSFRWVKQI